MSEPVILDSIVFSVDPEKYLRRLRLTGREEYEKRAVELATSGVAAARPRAMYRPAYIESKSDNSVVVDGVTLTSRVLRVNLEEAQRVFAFVATCGREMQTWAESITDMLERFWADTLMEMAVHHAFGVVRQHIGEHFLPGPMGCMDPGSLQDWPLEQQRELFTLLGDTRGLVGVELTDSCLMVPIKSVSGIIFPTEVHFENCQLCPREVCSGRRAEYDPDLFARRYAPEQRR
jgi:hypothetical protein